MNEKIKFNVSDDVNLQDDFEDSDADVETSEEVSEKFYASGIYNELRDAMQDTDFRLFLINSDIVIPGTLDGNEIQFLDIVGDDENKEFVMKQAPQTLDELLEFKTLYNVTNSEIDIPEDKEVSEAPHEEIVEYILNLKVDDKDTDDVEDDEQEIEQKENEEDKEEDENENNEQQ